MSMDTTGTFMEARTQGYERHWSIGFSIWFCALVPPLLLMAAIAQQPWIDPGDLLRDTLAVAEMKTECCKVYYRAVSNLGIMTWIGGAAVCLFSAAVLAMRSGRGTEVSFLVVAGLFTAFLAMDDLFLVHENVLPAFGVSEPVTYAAYGALGLAYLVFASESIVEHRYILFAAACGLLATSVLIDWQVHTDHPLRIVLEDGAKLTGIVCWTAFHLDAAWTLLKSELAKIRYVSFA
ncbi:MAG: hypothetical protein ACR2PM_05835 [Hyphomicrobiales bacterium]